MKNEKVDFAKIEALSGPPSVLRSEDRELYEKFATASWPALHQRMSWSGIW